KIFIPKQKPAQSYTEEKIALDPELEEALTSATDTELCDLAAILGMTNLITNNQFCDIVGSSNGVDKDSFSMNVCNLFVCNCIPYFSDIVKGEKMLPVFDEPPNPTNVEESL
ncbi:hypothetical protein ASZ78_013229, partial [Callipepla squamata]